MATPIPNLSQQGPETIWVGGDFTNLNFSATSGLADWTHLETDAAATTLLSLVDTGGVVILTQAANNDDVISLIGNAGFKLSELKAGTPIEFYGRFKVTDADDCDIHIGLGIHDTSYVASAPADYCAFRLVDGDAGLDLVVSKDSVATTGDNLATIADDTWARVWFSYQPGSGDLDTGTISYDISSNGTRRFGSFACNGTFPDDVVIFPVIQFQNGAAAADVCKVDYAWAKGTRAAWVDGTG
jgi:hypothetical protein